MDTVNMLAVNLRMIHPSLRQHPDAVDFGAFLWEKLPLTNDDVCFLNGYVWETAIPEREQWAAEAEKLAAHFASLGYGSA
jgi:hypothetical protein